MMPPRPRSDTIRVVTGRLATLGIVLGAALLAGCAGPPPPPLRLHADVKQLMAAVVDPNADLVWDAVGTVITVEGREEIRPRDDEEWDHVAFAAWTLAEAGNSLMIANRPKDTADWMRFAQELSDQGLKAARAAEARDADALFTAGGDLYLACTACHERYNINLTSPVQ
jgi:hypothetical protein